MKTVLVHFHNDPRMTRYSFGVIRKSQLRAILSPTSCHVCWVSHGRHKRDSEPDQERKKEKGKIRINARTEDRERFVTPNQAFRRSLDSNEQLK